MSDDPKQSLLDQASSLGIPVDGRWSVDTLAEKVKEASNPQPGDTLVILLKDAFPREGEKRRKGETIKVPADMAKRWYRAKVAIPGDEEDA